MIELTSFPPAYTMVGSALTIAFLICTTMFAAEGMSFGIALASPLTRFVIIVYAISTMLSAFSAIESIRPTMIFEAATLNFGMTSFRAFVMDVTSAGTRPDT